MSAWRAGKSHRHRRIDAKEGVPWPSGVPPRDFLTVVQEVFLVLQAHLSSDDYVVLVRLLQTCKTARAVVYENVSAMELVLRAIQRDVTAA